MELEQLNKKIAACSKCPLNQKPYNPGKPTQGLGTLRAKLMLLGEAPGEEESKCGVPFVGKSGKILQTILAEEIGLTMDDIYVTNVVKHRPPNNRTPTTEEIETCFEFLKQEIEIVHPILIVCLGKSAEKAMTSFKDKIYTPVCVTHHPAYLIYNPSSREKFISDLKKFYEEACYTPF